jgi:Flp pilus assembly protein TadG
MYIKAKTSRRKSIRVCRRGSTLVEFALILPILLAMLLGIIEFGWLAKNHLALANAAREGARAASLGKTTTEISTRVRGAAAGSGVGGANDTTRLVLNLNKDEDGAPYTYPTTLGDSGSSNNAATGSMIRVQIVYQHKSLTNFIPFLNKTLTINVVMRREA